MGGILLKVIIMYQRIPPGSSDLSCKVMFYLFCDMESSGILDPTNEVDLSSMRAGTATIFHRRVIIMSSKSTLF